jgi:hypothetical protein
MGYNFFQRSKNYFLRIVKVFVGMQRVKILFKKPAKRGS